MISASMVSLLMDLKRKILKERLVPENCVYHGSLDDLSKKRRKTSRHNVLNKKRKLGVEKIRKVNHFMEPHIRSRYFLC